MSMTSTPADTEFALAVPADTEKCFANERKPMTISEFLGLIEEGFTLFVNQFSIWGGVATPMLIRIVDGWVVFSYMQDSPSVSVPNNNPLLSHYNRQGWRALPGELVTRFFVPRYYLYRIFLYDLQEFAAQTPVVGKSPRHASQRFEETLARFFSQKPDLAIQVSRGTPRDTTFGKGWAMEVAKPMLWSGHWDARRTTRR